MGVAPGYVDQHTQGVSNLLLLCGGIAMLDEMGEGLLLFGAQ